MPRSLARAALILAGIVTALLAAEAGARWREHRAAGARLAESGPGPAPGQVVTLGDLVRPSGAGDTIYELRAGLEGVVYAGAPVSTNTLGMRGPEPDLAPSETSFTILGLGDSVMFGQGVPDGREYLARLGRELAREDPARDWRVLNAAVPGYNTAQQVAWLRERGLALRPDLVVLGFVSNDVNLPSFLERRPDPWALDRSALVEWLAGRELRRARLVPAPTEENNLFRVESDPERVPPEYRHLVGWAAVERALDELAELAEEHDFDVLVFSHRESEHSGRALEAARERGFEVCDLAPRLERYMQERGIRRYRGSELTVSDEDPHPSTIHHRIAADALRRTLARIGLTTPPAD